MVWPHQTTPMRTRFFAYLGSTAVLAALLVLRATAQQEGASIAVDTGSAIGTASDYLFGQNIEYEHGAVSGNEQNLNHEHGVHSGGLWAEMLRDRKFEEGDLDQDGVANGWVPEERTINRWGELLNGKRPFVKYRIDTAEFYGGGASQAIDLSEAGHQASVLQIGLQFQRGKKYDFYVYLKRRGSGTAFVNVGALERDSYARKDLENLSETWTKYKLEFTAPEDTTSGRVQIGYRGVGTLWIDSASLMRADNYHGIRADVIEAVKPLKVPVVRYPGGCFADIYHWRDGIGDRDQRPERWSDMWNEWEPNDFGTDEFMDFARATGFDAQITANYLTGTTQEAVDWLQYANGSQDTPMGKLRAGNGHPQPYNVKLWALGNEVQELCSDQYVARNDVNEYARRFEEFRTAMLQTDPSVKLMAVGAGPGPMKWNTDLLKLDPNIELLGASIYTGDENGRKDDIDTKLMDLEYFYRHVVAEPLDFKRQLEEDFASMGQPRPDGNPRLAVTEFQAWWLTEKVDEDLRLADALYVASIYNELLRQSNRVSIAEIESLINVQGIIEANQTSLKLTPEYFACMLYRLHTGKTVLATKTNSSPVPFNANLPMLDAIATKSADGKTIYLSVVNRADAADVTTNINLKGAPSAERRVKIFEVNGPDKVAANPFGSANVVNIANKSANVHCANFSYKFPAHSITTIEIPAQ